MKWLRYIFFLIVVLYEIYKGKIRWWTIMSTYYMSRYLNQLYTNRSRKESVYLAITYLSRKLKTVLKTKYIWKFIFQNNKKTSIQKVVYCPSIISFDLVKCLTTTLHSTGVLQLETSCVHQWNLSKLNLLWTNFRVRPIQVKLAKLSYIRTLFKVWFII